MVKKLWMIIWISERKPHCYQEVCSISKSTCVYLDDHFYANGSILIVPVFHPTRTLKVMVHSVSSDVSHSLVVVLVRATGQPLLSSPSGQSHLTCDWAEALLLECLVSLKDYFRCPYIE